MSSTMSGAEYLLRSQAAEQLADGCCSLWDGVFSKHRRCYIKPGKCKVNCEGCDLIIRVSKRCVSDSYNDTFGVSLVSSAELSTLLFEIDHQKFCLYAIEGTSNPWHLIGTPRFSESASSPSSMALAHMWLDECLKQHTNCRIIESSKLPTRVLDLCRSDSGIIALKETNGSKGRYVCLSYCWGESEFVMTTIDTLESHRRGIAIKSLPQTFQDAIRICQALGVQYLWVDALCIIQKQRDNADWNRESVCMADVYRNSHFTIAAVSSNSVYGGCFKSPKDGVKIGPITVQKMKHFPNDPYPKWCPDFPLLTRAWAYQERMLAPRILYFGRHELLWDCKHHRTCECGGASYLFDEVSKKEFNQMVSDGHCENPIALQQLWRQMVVQYSRLQLSFRTDKLPALSGLAAELQRKIRQTYLGGLWRDSFLADMCWYQSPIQDIQSESQTWRLPTWSWASTDVPVTYCQTLYRRGAEMCETLCTHARILDARCILSGPSPTGPVTGGFVDLDCAMIPVSLTLVTVHAGSKKLRWRSDGRCKVESLGRYYVIPLLNVGRHFHGLIVTPKVKDSEEMIRIGLVEERGVQPGQLPRTEMRRVRIV